MKADPFVDASQSPLYAPIYSCMRYNCSYTHMSNYVIPLTWRNNLFHQTLAILDKWSGYLVYQPIERVNEPLPRCLGFPWRIWLLFCLANIWVPPLSNLELCSFAFDSSLCWKFTFQKTIARRLHVRITKDCTLWHISCWLCGLDKRLGILVNSWAEVSCLQISYNPQPRKWTCGFSAFNASLRASAQWSALSHHKTRCTVHRTLGLSSPTLNLHPAQPHRTMRWNVPGIFRYHFFWKEAGGLVYC